MTNDRLYWIELLERISRPVLENLRNQTLRKNMPVGRPERKEFAHLEALGRLIAGISAWLERPTLDDANETRRQHYGILVREAIAVAVDPQSPDYMNFTQGTQPLVDAAFLAQGILRAPVALWELLDEKCRARLIESLIKTRAIKPHFNNWLLFSAIIEVALSRMGAEYDPVRIDYALQQHQQWYKGGGAYGDGPEFHWDYYNSFVIHPMLIDIVNHVGGHYPAWRSIKERVFQRAARYAEALERMISPGGTFPPLGRSLTYRVAAFHLLSQLVLLHRLPPSILPGQARAALTAVVHRTKEMPGTFDKDGWLTIGLCGTQPELAEGYISTGSLYLCSTVLLPLGLDETDPFWTSPNEDWTARKIWCK